MWREEENIFYQEVDVVKNKNLEDVTVDSCRQKPDVLSSIQGLRELVKADSIWICFVTKHHYTALLWFSFFFVLDPVVFRPHCKCQRGLEYYSFG